MKPRETRLQAKWTHFRVGFWVCSAFFWFIHLFLMRYPLNHLQTDVAKLPEQLPEWWARTTLALRDSFLSCCLLTSWVPSHCRVATASAAHRTRQCPLSLSSLSSRACLGGRSKRKGRSPACSVSQKAESGASNPLFLFL